MAESQYARLARLLEERIHAGEYPAGSRIPSERDLCDLYGVSRITVRQAVADLVNRGVLTREHGRGTFVATPRIEHSLFDHFTFAEMLRSKGLLVATTVLEQGTAEATLEVAEQLEVPPQSGVARLVRQRSVDGTPYALETTYLPASLLPGIETADFSTRSLYEVLAADYRTQPVRARESFEPVIVTSQEAAALEVKRGAPALLLRRTTYDQSGRAVEFAKAVIRGDRCRMLVELWAGGGAQAPVLTGGRAEGGTGRRAR